MTDYTVKIKKQTVKEVVLRITPLKAKERVIKVEIKAQIGAPKDKDNDTALLNVELEGTSKDDDKFFLHIETDFIFEFGTIPDNYQEVAKTTCLPLVQERIYDIADKILEAAGHPPLRLANQTIIGNEFEEID